MKKSAFTQKIESELKKLSPKEINSTFGADYIFGKQQDRSKLKYLGIKMPVLKNTLYSWQPNKKNSLSTEHFEKMQQLWFESDIHEVKVFALYWLESQPVEFLTAKAKELLKWAHIVDNWAISDSLSGTYAKIVDHSPTLMLPTYAKWNSDKNPWLRRISMVGLYYYSRMRKNLIAFEEATKMVSRHFAAEEYYVQKGVGWTIREMYNVYPDQTLKFIDKNLHQISPVAWVAASEKLKPPIKKQLLVKRKKVRKK